VTRIRTASPLDIDPCVGVLARLPEYFTPDTHEHVRHGMTHHRAWVATRDREVIGFVLVERRYPTAAEITFAAVLPEDQGRGAGTELVDAALGALAEDGVVIVEVKTLDASAGYEPYIATRRFWEHRGFRQVDCIDPLPGWQPDAPAAIYVAALAPTR
jgi:ribosomal protein S18 acetylase RimI-like enzyme